MDMNNHNIIMIPTSKLYHHPKNPRTDYNDVDELSDSIRTMGVLQNLTVVPYCDADHADAKVADPDDSYIVIIGNRRLEGAWKAQVETVPCIISDMDYKTQIMTMAAENMLRSDLTPYAQAQHFQLMLDLGESIDSVAEKTGFSTTTVRSRIKLLDLDQGKFAKADARGASLTDYLKLNKLTSTELKNTVLDSIGTVNFENELKKALEKENKKKYMDDTFAAISAFATQIANRNDAANLHYVCCYGTWNRRPVEIPEDSATANYYFTATDSDINLYREHIQTDEDLAAAAEVQRKAEKAKREENEVRELAIRMHELRRDFISNISAASARKKLPLIASFYVQATLRLNEDVGYYYAQNRKAHLPTVSTLLEIDYDMDTKEMDPEKLDEKLNSCPEYVMLCVAYSMWDKPNLTYIDRKWDGNIRLYINEYSANDTLDELYAFLEELGYQPCDEEKMFQNGNHPIFHQAPDETEAGSADNTDLLY